MEAFAFHVYRRYLRGETPQQLSTEVGIPLDRIERRLRVAERYRDKRGEPELCEASRVRDWLYRAMKRQ